MGIFKKSKNRKSNPKKEKRQEACRPPKRVLYAFSYTKGIIESQGKLWQESLGVRECDSMACESYACYRGRGRSGGRAVSGRGRMRKRGPSGGGTLRRRSPQQGQWPSFAVEAVISARIQWPRASQSGLMHCTVKPGKYCIFLPQRPQSSGRFMCNRAAVGR